MKKLNEMPDNIVLDSQPKSKLKHNRNLYDRLKKAIDELAMYPERGKQLTTSHNLNIWSWKVGRYRILYKINTPSPGKVFIIKIGLRETIYKGLAGIEKIKRGDMSID